MENDNTTVITGKPAKTREGIRKAIEGELTEARLKEVRGKLKQLILDLQAAKAVVKAKEDEIAALYEAYADVLPE